MKKADRTLEHVASPEARLRVIELEVGTEIVMRPEFRKRLLALAKGKPKREMLRALKRWGQTR